MQIQWGFLLQFITFRQMLIGHHKNTELFLY